MTEKDEVGPITPEKLNKISSITSHMKVISSVILRLDSIDSGIDSFGDEALIALQADLDAVLAKHNIPLLKTESRPKPPAKKGN